jgi:aryl-alcohol dehydrogenase-like predicted oxidoreductase
MVRELERFARDELDCSVSQLAVAWTLANPAVHVAIVGALRAQYIDEAVAATELRLGEHELERIDRIMTGAMAFTGPAPEMMPTT